MSITGFAARPGTAVDPLWSMRRASDPSTAWIRSRSIAKSCGHRGSYGTISIIVPDCSARDGHAGEARQGLPTRASLLQQDILEELNRARIVRLAEPEHRLLAH